MFIKDYVPFFISNLEEFKKLYSSQQLEIDKNNFDLNDILEQCFISTATWGIAKWEEFLGIKVVENESLQDRRNRCLAKIRGVGTTTVEVVKNIVKSYVTGTIDVIEHYKDYSFTIDIKSVIGFTKVNGLKDAIEEVKPAHLAVNYKFNSISSQKIYFGNYAFGGEHTTIYPQRKFNFLTNKKINIANYFLSAEDVTVYPKLKKGGIINATVLYNND